MELIQSIVATNSVVKLPDGTSEVFTNESLEDAAAQLNNGGGRPLLINHDWNRLIGWTHRAWVEADGLKVRLFTESLIPQTTQEQDELMSIFADYCERQHAERVAPFRDARATFPDDSVDLSHDFNCVYLTGKDLVKRVYPSLYELIDEDGLLAIDLMEGVNGEWLSYESSLIVPDCLLRRGWGLPNPPNTQFVSALLEIKRRNPDLTVRIAIDRNRLGIPESLNEYREREYWWGPPFAGHPANQAKGVTVHGPTTYDALSGLKQTEFWNYGRDEQTLQVEEVFEEPVWLMNGSDLRTPARFIHTIFDPVNGLPSHLDGAVRLYSQREWKSRINVTIDKFGKRGFRHKLWAVDGEIQIDDWYRMIHMFYRGNFTIAEYFGLQMPNHD